MDLIGVGLSVLGVCGPLTAAIIKFVPRRDGNGNGNGNGSKYVTTREFDGLKTELRIQHAETRASIGALESLIKTRL